MPHEDVNAPLPETLEPDTVLLVRTADPANVGVPEHEVIELERDLTVEILFTPLTDGRTALLAFTSEDELREWAPEGSPYIGLGAAEVLRIAFKSRQDVDVVYVNAANSEGKVFVIPREDFPSAG